CRIAPVIPSDLELWFCVETPFWPCRGGLTRVGLRAAGHVSLAPTELGVFSAFDWYREAKAAPAAAFGDLSRRIIYKQHRYIFAASKLNEAGSKRLHQHCGRRCSTPDARHDHASRSIDDRHLYVVRSCDERGVEFRLRQRISV